MGKQVTLEIVTLIIIIVTISSIICCIANEYVVVKLIRFVGSPTRSRQNTLLGRLKKPSVFTLV